MAKQAILTKSWRHWKPWKKGYNDVSLARDLENQERAGTIATDRNDIEKGRDPGLGLEAFPDGCQESDFGYTEHRHRLQVAPTRHPHWKTDHGEAEVESHHRATMASWRQTVKYFLCVHIIKCAKYDPTGTTGFFLPPRKSATVDATSRAKAPTAC